VDDSSIVRDVIRGTTKVNISDLHQVPSFQVFDDRAAIDELQQYFSPDAWRKVCTVRDAAHVTEWPCHTCKSTTGNQKKWVQYDHCLAWSYYSCVGVKRKPKGRWFCADCKWMVHDSRNIFEKNRVLSMQLLRLCFIMLWDDDGTVFVWFFCSFLSVVKDSSITVKCYSFIMNYKSDWLTIVVTYSRIRDWTAFIRICINAVNCSVCSYPVMFYNVMRWWWCCLRLIFFEFSVYDK